jgi:hypothetical protein
VNPPLHIGQRLRPNQIHRKQNVTRIPQMRMRVVESWHRKRPTQIDHLCPGALIFRKNRSIVAGRKNLPMRDGDRRNPLRMRPVQPHPGQNISVMVDRIGRRANLR